MKVPTPQHAVTRACAALALVLPVACAGEPDLYVATLGVLDTGTPSDDALHGPADAADTRLELGDDRPDARAAPSSQDTSPALTLDLLDAPSPADAQDADAPALPETAVADASESPETSAGPSDVLGPDGAVVADIASVDVAPEAPCGPSSCTAAQLPVPTMPPVEPPGLGGCPPGMALIPATAPFCIDRWEAAVVSNVDGAPLTPFAPPPANARAVSAPGVTPQGYTSGIAAGAACESAGKRLCTDTEWLRACQGPDGWSYPYGPARVPGRCNDARPCHPAIQYFGTSASWIWSELNHPCLNQLPFGLGETGEYALCVTPEDVYDLMGNLHEWTADPAGTFRGGFYVDTVINGEGCLYKTTAHSTAHHDYSTGFRCCADP